jgi:formate dehydrogenase assembly factor FdhD
MTLEWLVRLLWYRVVVGWFGVVVGTVVGKGMPRRRRQGLTVRVRHVGHDNVARVPLNGFQATFQAQKRNLLLGASCGNGWHQVMFILHMVVMQIALEALPVVRWYCFIWSGP